MVEPSYIGSCPTCCGMLEIVISEKKGICSIMCDECSAHWDTPENAIKRIGGYRESYNGENKVRTASLEEIEAVGWKKYIKRD